jgi:hypothetical protein
LAGWSRNGNIAIYNAFSNRLASWKYVGRNTPECERLNRETQGALLRLSEVEYISSMDSDNVDKNRIIIEEL